MQKIFRTPGNRPHGLAFDGRYLWHGDSNLAAFFKYDTDTGSIVEKIQLSATLRLCVVPEICIPSIQSGSAPFTGYLNGPIPASMKSRRPS